MQRIETFRHYWFKLNCNLFQAAAAELKKKRTFRKFQYRGVDLDQLLDMGNEQLMELFTCRIRRKISRGLKRKPMALIKKLRKKKKECPPNEKPDVVKTHLRDMIIVPEMTGSIVGVYNGKTFNQVEIKVIIDWNICLHILICALLLTAWDDWTLSWRILHHIQARQTRKARYWCHSLFSIHPIEVNICYVFIANKR